MDDLKSAFSLEISNLRNDYTFGLARYKAEGYEHNQFHDDGYLPLSHISVLLD